LAGSFISDGNGHITSGVVDGNSVAGQPFNTTVSGTYFIAANGLNTLTIQGQSYGPVTFAFVLDASANGRIIEYDDTTGQGSRGSGVLRKANPSAFSLSSAEWQLGVWDGGSHAGRRIFLDHCAHCHGKDAEGTKKRPSLKSSRVQQQATDGDLHWLLVNGSRSQGMPSWVKLGDPQIWQVICYVKSLH
jgi:hypothetical protein